MNAPHRPRLTPKRAATVTLGGLLAVLCSWTVNKSVLWAVVHFFCSWPYVVYAMIAHGDVLDRAVDTSLGRVELHEQGRKTP